MKKVLIIGAGRSSSSLIRYLINNKKLGNYTLTIVDKDIKLARQKAGSEAEVLDRNILDENERQNLIENHDLVISMLPARFHYLVIKDCIKFKKNIVTPSYISKETKALEGEINKAGILVLSELGVDPGIDHMSAMEIIDNLRNKGNTITCFESFTGGLVAPESDDNPWNYKFTWNPRNVVLAGQGGASKFVQNGTYKFIPYHKLFRRTEFIHIENYGKFEGYANRDSLKYCSVYDLEDIPTMYRGTLRRVGFCRAWDVFVQLGITDDSYLMPNVEKMTHRDFINSFLAYNPHDSVELKLRYYLKIDQDDELWEKLEWLGIFEDTPIELKEGTPAQILQHILEKKWSLTPYDKDMIVMWHKFQYKDSKGKRHELHSSMVNIGEDATYTAMSNTVGLPLAIAAKNILNGNIKSRGLKLPIEKEIYSPILNELKDYGIVFTEKKVEPIFY